ncbi:MAG TPA: iron-containing alcohol dehydrogenase [Spirochaetota bacterium]|nr:iron-containing alcohol dehydrogenase [Spirochaetota bacterium]
MKTSVKPDFHIPSEIYIRQDIINDIASISSKYGTRAVLITTTENLEIYHATVEFISDQFRKEGIGCIIYDELPACPTTEDIDTAVSFTKKTNANLIIGFGGIEAINSAKAVAILCNNYLFCNDLFSQQELRASPMTLLTIPASPLFGFEIAPLFFLDEIHGMTKKVFYNYGLFPAATIVDPVLSISISEEKAIKSSISTLAISTESVISTKNNNIINTYALKSIDLIFRNLPSAYREPQSINPRIFLSTASVMAGMAFSVSYLSVTLSLALALASRSKITIESAMSVILPHIMEFNLTTAPGKYVQMSKVMGEEVRDITVIEAAIKAVEAIRKIEADTDVPQRLANYDVPKSQFKDIASLAMGYPFIKNTPRPLNENEIETILIAAY